MGYTQWHLCWKRCGSAAYCRSLRVFVWLDMSLWSVCLGFTLQVNLPRVTFSSFVFLGGFFLLLAKSRLNKYKCANTWPFAWLEYFITSTWNCHHFQTISNNLQYTSYHCPAEDPDLEEARSGSRKALSSCSHSRAIMLVLLYYAHLLLWWQHLKILHFMTKCTKIA